MAKAQKTSYAETAPSAMGRAPAVASTKLTDQLSPNRSNALKVTSLEDGNIRGGYWVLNQDGEGATIAFCFKNSDGGIFGLTVGHLFQNVGDSVFVFLRNHPTPAPVPGYVRSCAAWDEMVEVGGVVSLDEETDSAVFEVNDAHIKGRVDLLKLLRRSGRGDRDLVLPRPCLNPLPPGRQDFLEDESDGGGRAAMDKKPAAKAAPDPNSKPFDRVVCVVCGAVTRGNVCVVSTPSLAKEDVQDEAMEVDIGLSWNQVALHLQQTMETVALFIWMPTIAPL